MRTDLALEAHEMAEGEVKGVSFHTEEKNGAVISKIEILNEEGAQNVGKPIGNYITVEVPPLSDNVREIDSHIEVVADEIRNLLPKEGLVLVAGLGNSDITPDALGPLTTDLVLATRHITGEFARSVGLENLRAAAVITPGVLGQTGIETGELLLGIVERLKPAAVIVVDALASRQLSRLGCTVQLSDAGISPGSGVGNARPKIDKTTLGVPVLSMGVPTVVDAATLAADLLSDDGDEENDQIRQKISPRGAQMMVTPREIDLLVERAARLVAMGINRALHPAFSTEDLYSLVS